MLKRTIFLFKIGRKYNKKVIVDAQKDLDNYKGVTSMTPNLPDTQKFVGYFMNKKLNTLDNYIVKQVIETFLIIQ